MPGEQMPPIRYSAFIGVAPDVLYTTLTTGAGWDAWFTTRATVDASPGGSYEFYWEDWAAERETVTLAGPVVEAEPNRLFSFRWKSGESQTTVRFDLEARGGGTIVRLTESGYSVSDADLAACLSCACGWGEALTLLKFYLEHGITYGAVPSE